MPLTSGSSAFAWRNAPGEGLELGLGDVVRVAPAEHRDVHGEAGVEGDRLEDVPHHRPGEVAADEVVLESGRLARVHEVRATRDVDDGLGERLVERHERVAVAGDAALVAERLADGLAEHDADVLDGVVHVDLDVAAGAHGEVGQRVLRERGQQVVVERHRGLDVAEARPSRFSDRSMLDSLVSRCTRAVRGAPGVVMSSSYSGLGLRSPPRRPARTPRSPRGTRSSRPRCPRSP